MRASSVLPLLLGLAAGNSRIEYHRVELPGFSLELPKPAAFTGDLKAQYRTGQVEARFGLKFVAVNWQVGEIATLEELPSIAKVMAAAIPDGARMTSQPARLEMINGHKATWLDAKIESIDVTFVDIECGKRSVMIGVGAATDFEAIRSRILKSFTCKPVEADEKAIASAVPIGVDDASVLREWFAVPNDDAFTISNGELLAVFTEIPHTAIDGKMLERVLPTLFAAYGGTWASARREKRAAVGGEREVHFGTMTMDGEPMPTALALWPCGGGGDMLMGMVMRMDGIDLEPGATFLTKVRCSQPGDPPLPLSPTPPEVSDPGADGE